MNTNTIRKRKMQICGSSLKKISGKSILTHLIIMLAVAFILIPLIWVVLGSLKGKVEFYMEPLSLPKQFLWQNYIEAWTQAEIGRGLFNSFLVTFGSLIPLLLLASLAAYGFARFKFWGNKLFFFIVLVGLMITPQVIVLPLSTILARMKLINTRLGLIFSYIAWSLPFSIFLLRAFFISIPQEIIDSARVDGCSSFGAFWKIAMPLVRPGLFSVAIFSGLNMWNEFLFALVFLRGGELGTLPVVLQRLKGMYTSEYTLMLAGLTMAAIPPLVLFLIFNREFMKGLTIGSLKI